jgi:hypothetical protein
VLVELGDDGHASLSAGGADGHVDAALAKQLVADVLLGGCCRRKRPARSPSWRMRTKPWGRTWSRKRRRSSWTESARTLGGHPKPPDGRSRLRQRIVMDGEHRLEAGCLASRVILLEVATFVYLN